VNARNNPDLEVRKTYKLYIGGAFPRSESGRSYPITAKDDRVVAQVSQASRKDFREAVRTARSALSGWSSKTPYLRGQILYRVAEMMESRKDALISELTSCGMSSKQASKELTAGIDHWVYYAGLTDKLGHLLGSVNPVAGPFLDLTHPEPVGVVGVIAPDDSPIAGLSAQLAAVLASGSVAVALVSESSPLAPLTMGEVIDTSDVPGGVINLLSGLRSELVDRFGKHDDLDSLELSGVDPETRRTIEVDATETLARTSAILADCDPLSDSATSVWAVSAFCELKTVWHPARL
jgi:acyl-CoA reductase-like NAD-dependent aldehyde dehydrogenase